MDTLIDTIHSEHDKALDLLIRESVPYIDTLNIRLQNMINAFRNNKAQALWNISKHQEELTSIFGSSASIAEKIKQISTENGSPGNGFYSEFCFADFFVHHINYQKLRLQKIPESTINHHQTPDFKIVNIQNNMVAALVECTECNLSCYDFHLLHLNHDAALTLLLGFNEVKRKIKEKIKQINNFTARHTEFDKVPKFILLDLGPYIPETAPANISYNHGLGAKIKKLNATDNKFNELFQDLKSALSGNNISVIPICKSLGYYNCVSHNVAVIDQHGLNRKNITNIFSALNMR